MSVKPVKLTSMKWFTGRPVSSLKVATDERRAAVGVGRVDAVGAVAGDLDAQVAGDRQHRDALCGGSMRSSMMVSERPVSPTRCLRRSLPSTRMFTGACVLCCTVSCFLHRLDGVAWSSRRSRRPSGPCSAGTEAHAERESRDDDDQQHGPLEDAHPGGRGGCGALRCSGCTAAPEAAPWRDADEHRGSSRFRAIVPHAATRRDAGPRAGAGGGRSFRRPRAAERRSPSTRSTSAPRLGELGVEGLVAAVDVVQAAHLGQALGHEAGDGERGAAAQVGRLDDAAGELARAR